MSSENAPVTVKKYANRRLYNTQTSAYVTLEDLASMVKRGEDFVVFDAKSGEDITRSVLAQIIFEQESKNEQSLLPTTFLRQLIRFYGDSMQILVPSYLEFSLDKLIKEGGGFGNASKNGAITNGTRPMFAQLEEQTRQNMAMFRQALSVFAPFPIAAALSPAPEASGAPRTANDTQPPSPASTPTASAEENDKSEFDDVRRQLEDLQRRIEHLSPKS